MNNRVDKAERAADALPLPGHQLWWRLLAARVDALRTTFPRDLQGVIQFCSAGADGALDLFHLVLAGQNSASHDGLAREPRLWIDLDADALAELLLAEPPRRPALRASGDLELLNRLFALLNQHQPPMSWLEARSAR